LTDCPIERARLPYVGSCQGRPSNDGASLQNLSLSGKPLLAASVGMNWFRQIAEQNLKQSRHSVEEICKVTRSMVDDFGNQASAICEHSMSLAEETMSNTFDCGFKMLRVRELQE